MAVVSVVRFRLHCAWWDSIKADLLFCFFVDFRSLLSENLSFGLYFVLKGLELLSRIPFKLPVKTSNLNLQVAMVPELWHCLCLNWHSM